MNDESVRRGRQLLREMAGERAAAMEATWEALDPDLANLILGFVAGEIWARPGLDRKTRSLITVAATAALGRPSALELNLRMARGNGASREEIVETLLHLAAYAGFPAAWEAMVIAKRVFEEESPGPVPG